MATAKDNADLSVEVAEALLNRIKTVAPTVSVDAIHGLAQAYSIVLTEMPKPPREPVKARVL